MKQKHIFKAYKKLKNSSNIMSNSFKYSHFKVSLHDKNNTILESLKISNSKMNKWKHY